MLPFPGTVEVTWGDQSARDVVPTTGQDAAVELNHTYRAPGAYTVIVSTRVVGSDQLFSVQVRVVIVPPGAAVPDEPGPGPDPELPPPEIESISPDHSTAMADFQAVITGRNFDANTSAFFGGFGEPMTWAQVLGSSPPTTLTVRAFDLSEGTYHVSVQDREGRTTTLENAFTVGPAPVPPAPEDGPPVLTAIEPAGGLGVPDTPFTLTGSNLAEVTRVTMRRTGAEVDLEFTIVSDTEITSVTGTNPPGGGMTIWTAVHNEAGASNELEGSVGAA
jgi:IPT/TIG domain-containing protein